MNEIAQRPTIVCLCGSVRFREEFERATKEETCKGNIVLSVGYFPTEAEKQEEFFLKHKPNLDQLHFRKIELADGVLILNVGGYIGESTANELAHARKLGKRIIFLEPDCAGKEKKC